MKRGFFAALGGLFLALGAVGLLLPVWPTTPFVLLAAGCFGAGSPRAYAWLAASPLFGEYIKDRRDKTGISKRTKITSLVFLWGMLALSAYFTGKLWVTLVLAAVGAAVTVHILLLRTKK